MLLFSIWFHNEYYFHSTFVLTARDDHKNETTCIYVLEKDFDAAKKAIVNYRETVRKSL